ncbi:hypothetical protein B0H14DRAFT_3512554 [Mycena olivaceomarginata]|nr:hypothetical protein B0H14DRAFT_3512554 [Mycena olivaceomarginata]
MPLVNTPFKPLRKSPSQWQEYTEFIDEPIFLHNFRLCDVISRHAAGPQADSDGESEAEDDDADVNDSSDDNSDIGGPQNPPSPRRSPTTTPTQSCKSRTPPIIRVARERWEARSPSPAPAPTSAAPPVDPAKAKKKKLHRASRRLKRETLREVPGQPRAPKAITLRHAENSSPILVNTTFRSHPGPEAREYSLEEVNKIPGMRVIDWQGVPSPLVDAEHYVFGVLGGQPRNSRWGPDVVEPAAKLMEEAAQNMYGQVFSGVYYGKRTHRKKKKNTAPQPAPRRRTHPAESSGPSMGGGQEFPTMFFHGVLKTIVLAGLLAQKPFRRIAGFANALFQSYAPALHEYYSQTMDRLYEWNPALLRNFPADVSVFAAATFNFGPRTITFLHLDFANLAWGWCAITALGDFDPDRGGTILIPSALIRHSNTSIQAHETRFSFTQYTSAGIFRFVDNGFKSDQLVNDLGISAAERAERLEARKTRWAEGLKMYRRRNVADS